MPYAIDVTLTNESEGWRFYDDTEDLDDRLLDDDRPDFGAIFRHAQSEYGRCVSSVYLERAGRPDARIGWYFQKRAKYDDTNGTYLQGAWVTVIERIPEQRIPLRVHERIAA